MSTEPMIICPSCREAIKLTESLAAPLIQSTRLEVERKLAQKDAEFAKRDRLLKERETSLQKATESLDNQVAEKLKTECARIATEEARKAKLALATDFDEKIREVAEMKEVLKRKDEKLVEAQKAQVDLIRKQRELDDARREMELTIEKRVQDSMSSVRDQAKKEAEESLSLKVMEKEQTILAMKTQIEELKRKSEQGSQQLQGEVLELQLETILGAKFPVDQIHAVAKGERGADVLQRIVLPNGTECGKILWESKRTKNWSDGWLVKLRDDQRAAKADIAVIVSAVLPRGIESFGQVANVWIVHPHCIVPVAHLLRHLLMEVGCARQASQGQQTKMEMVYEYLNGSKFRLRVEAIIEAFTAMSKELTAEKTAIMSQWAKREKQIERVMAATVGLHGDLQGISGQSLQQIDGLEVKMLAGTVD